MRPYDPDDRARMAAGIYKSLRQKAYEYPVRPLRKSKDGHCVTLPLQVRNYLELEYGDWLAFGSTPCPGLAGFVRVSAEQFETIAADGLKEFRKLARKIMDREGSLFVRIPPAIRKIISAEVGDSLIFDIAPGQGKVVVAAIKGGGESAGCRRTG
ncbi:hypothetical protein ES703_13519 [subsurface metagenome]